MKTEEERKFSIKLDAFETAFLLSFITQNKDERSEKVLRHIKEQLIAIGNEIREKAGIKVEKISDGMLKLTTEDGTTMLRSPYEWEKY